MKSLKIITSLVFFLIGGLVAIGQNDSKNIVENAMMSKDHTTLVAAVKAADLVDVLQSDGPFTVFAPVNSAFDALPDGTVESLLKEENQKQLQAVLTYHV
ncbi:MAG: fasciclin domain-containing protein, partial [Salegentibacter mishustinae]|nr:fasciclin domain-containing protein [Salegentibacter mishustinae]